LTKAEGEKLKAEVKVKEFAVCGLLPIAIGTPLPLWLKIDDR